MNWTKKKKATLLLNYIFTFKHIIQYIISKFHYKIIIVINVTCNLSK